MSEEKRTPVHKTEMQKLALLLCRILKFALALLTKEYELDS